MNTSGWEIIDFKTIPGTPCPCGTARRGYLETEDFPGSLHVTTIEQSAKLHYHKFHQEVYYILEAMPGSKMQLDDEVVEIKPGMSILIRAGTRHRAIGLMQVLILSLPKFDPEDEWFD